MSKNYDVARTMPPLRHSTHGPGEMFDIQKSEVVAWIKSQPKLMQLVFDKILERGLIVFDSETKTWRGRDWKPEHIVSELEAEIEKIVGKLSLCEFCAPLDVMHCADMLTTSDGLFECTRPAGHDGNHVACGWGPNPSFHKFAAWPQAPSQPPTNESECPRVNTAEDAHPRL